MAKKTVGDCQSWWDVNPANRAFTLSELGVHIRAIPWKKLTPDEREWIWIYWSRRPRNGIDGHEPTSGNPQRGENVYVYGPYFVRIWPERDFFVLRGNWNQGLKFPSIKEAQAYLRDYGFKRSPKGDRLNPRDAAATFDKLASRPGNEWMREIDWTYMPTHPPTQADYDRWAKMPDLLAVSDDCRRRMWAKGFVI